MIRPPLCNPRCGYLAALILCVALVFLPQTAKAAQRDQLVIGISQFPDNFNPNINDMAAKAYILFMGRRPITVFGPDWKLDCMLCTELPSLDKGTARYEKTADGKDGIAVTYTLRPGLRWGDGTPLTTKDVVFTWEVGRHPKSGVSNAELYRRIERITVRDDRTFTLHLDKRTCDFADISDFGLLPAHIEKANFADPFEYRNRSAYETDTTNPGLWFGPYRVTRVEPGAFVVLEPNPTWTGEKPKFKRIIVRTIQNTAAMTANLLSGAIDYIPGELGLTLDQAIAFRKRHPDRFHYIFKPSLIYEHIDLNLDNPILADRRVRRALIHAIDRKAITTQLFDGHLPVANGPVSPLDTVYDANVPRYAYEPDHAKALLDEAGWRRGPGGVRVNAKGERLQLQIMTTAGDQTRALIQQALRSNWRAVGIDMRIRNEPARVLFGDTVTHRKFPGLVMYAWYAAPQQVPRSQLHSSQIPAADNGWSGENYPGFRNAEMDKALDGAQTVCDPKGNQAQWNRLQTIYAEELPILPLYFRAEPYILPKWLKGVRPTGHQYFSTNWVEQWRAVP